MKVKPLFVIEVSILFCIKIIKFLLWPFKYVALWCLSFESISLLLFREIFQCSVLLSFWRVRHAWHKNILKKCSENEKRAEILRQLEKTVDGVRQGDENVDSFEQMIKDQADDPEFVDYFKATWCPRLGLYPSLL